MDGSRNRSGGGGGALFCQELGRKGEGDEANKPVEMRRMTMRG